MAKIFQSDDESMQALHGMKVLLIQEVPGDPSTLEITIEGMNATFIAYPNEIQDVD